MGWTNIKDIEGKKQGDQKEDKKESTIMEAIGDIDKELEKLKKERGELESSSKNVGENITSAQVEESNLRQKISVLVEKEGQLEKNKSKLKEKLESIKSKIAKVSRIKEELSEIE